MITTIHKQFPAGETRKKSISLNHVRGSMKSISEGTLPPFSLGDLSKVYSDAF